MAGTDSQCWGFACCHLLGDGKLPEGLDPEYIAGPYGHKNCDMPLGGVRQVLSSLKKDHLFNTDPNIIVVTGNVISDQVGQLTLDQHKTVVKAAYAMIKQVFPDSYIFPVYGNSDMFPSWYQTFNFTKNMTKGFDHILDCLLYTSPSPRDQG